MNKLPKSWGVENNGTQRFKDTVVKFLKKEYDSNITGTTLNYYYGISKTGELDVSSNQDNYTRILELDEFIELLNGNDVFSLTKEKILQMAGESTEVKKSLMKAFPDAFKKGIDIIWRNDRAYDDNTGYTMIVTRSGGNYKDSFWLSPEYHWHMLRDNEGEWCLVPTKKEE